MVKNIKNDEEKKKNKRTALEAYLMRIMVWKKILENPGISQTEIMKKLKQIECPFLNIPQSTLSNIIKELEDNEIIIVVTDKGVKPKRYAATYYGALLFLSDFPLMKFLVDELKNRLDEDENCIKNIYKETDYKFILHIIENATRGFIEYADQGTFLKIFLKKEELEEYRKNLENIYGRDIFEIMVRLSLYYWWIYGQNVYGSEKDTLLNYAAILFYPSVIFTFIISDAFMRYGYELTEPLFLPKQRKVIYRKKEIDFKKLIKQTLQNTNLLSKQEINTILDVFEKYDVIVQGNKLLKNKLLEPPLEFNFQ